MVIWISKALALALHDRQLAEHGGQPGIRDERSLDAALARPQRLLTHGNPRPDIAALAASLAFGLARNRPFLDGNKRTAHVCYRVFLRLNGADLSARDEERYVATLGLASGSITEEVFAEWLRDVVVVAPGNRVQEKRAAYAR